MQGGVFGLSRNPIFLGMMLTLLGLFLVIPNAVTLLTFVMGIVWLWLREGKSIKYALGGSVVLILYGVIPTFQPANFGRVYAAYGGVFVALSLLWGWRIDKIVPDRFDVLGGLVALLGVFIIMYTPRN